MGKNNEAITYFDKVLALNPKDAESLNNKGVSLVNLGNYYKGIKYFDRALAVNPDYSLALKNKQKTLDLLK
jgi:tetratricopeptide (TPR) repeat protein